MSLHDELAALVEKATPGPYRAHDHTDMARVTGADPNKWLGYAWVGRIVKDSTPDGRFDAGWLSTDRRKDASKEYRERAAADVQLVAAVLNNLPTILAALKAQEGLATEDFPGQLQRLYDTLSGEMLEERGGSLWCRLCLQDAGEDGLHHAPECPLYQPHMDETISAPGARAALEDSKP